MANLLLLFLNPAYIEPPNGWIGWLGWAAFFMLLIFLAWKWRFLHPKWGKLQWGIFILLVLLTPVFSLLIPGFRLESTANPAPLFIPSYPSIPIIMFLSAVPWLLAAGFLGSMPAGLLALISGVLLAFWNTHHPFLPLELGLSGCLAGAAFQQRYRTPFFMAIRRPFVMGAFLALFYPALYLVDVLFVNHGLLASRVDFAVASSDDMAALIGGPIFLAGILVEPVSLLFRSLWGGKGAVKPSPAERRLSARFLYIIAPIAGLLVIALSAGIWYVAGNAAREMLEGRMVSSADTAAESVPFFLETGQNLFLQLASDPDLYQLEGPALQEQLAADLLTVPYFSALFVLDAQGQPKAGYPLLDIGELGLTAEEIEGISVALSGVPINFNTVPAVEGARAAQISFIAPIHDGQGRTRGVLLGRSDLSENPFARPLLIGLESILQVDGEGMLLDEEGHILFHPDTRRMMGLYEGQTASEPVFFEENDPQAGRQIVYYRPISGRRWAVVLKVPAHYAQQQAVRIAAPLLLMVLALSAVAVVLIRFALRVVTGSLQKLTTEAGRMAKGQLDQPLKIDGEDEVGQLGGAFEQMRAKLKARLDELNRLLVVSQGVASSLEIETSLKQVLDSALVMGASSARVVLAPGLAPQLTGDRQIRTRFGVGPATDIYQYLDDQVLALSKQQPHIQLTNLTRPRIFIFTPGIPRPAAMLAVALKHEQLFYGTLWLAYDNPHIFHDEEVRFVFMLAQQASLAAANARLFQTAEIGRESLDGILASSPDPVLVTDQRNQLWLANPAAVHVLGLGLESGKGMPIDKLIQDKILVDLMKSSGDESQSAEVTLQDGRVYLATASSVTTDGRRSGRVCVMRDVTRFKELDALKSDFVSTVSHDLRQPLQLIGGYASMMMMVGELNTQQKSYLSKIQVSVENMTRMVTNLLDLGRLEADIGLQLEVFPIENLVDDVVEELHLQAAQKRIQVMKEISPQLNPVIEADRALLHRALHNLIENAIKYTDTGGQVKICLRYKQDNLVFEVRDTGIGIAPADQQRLFEKFYRAVIKGSRYERGSGLGLAIVKSIAKRHGGDVGLDSQLGKGSSFYMWIPRQPKR